MRSMVMALAGVMACFSMMTRFMLKPGDSIVTFFILYETSLAVQPVCGFFTIDYKRAVDALRFAVCTIQSSIHKATQFTQTDLVF